MACLIKEPIANRGESVLLVNASASTHPDHSGLLKVGYTERIAGQGTSPDGLTDKVKRLMQLTISSVAWDET